MTDFDHWLPPRLVAEVRIALRLQGASMVTDLPPVYGKPSL
jgi:hypothetical protein